MIVKNSNSDLSDKDIYVRVRARKLDIIQQFGAAVTKKKKLNPNTQQLLLENAIVNRIQNEVAHANAFDLRSFRLRLEMEDA